MMYDDDREKYEKYKEIVERVSGVSLEEYEQWHTWYDGGGCCDWYMSCDPQDSNLHATVDMAKANGGVQPKPPEAPPWGEGELVEVAIGPDDCDDCHYDDLCDNHVDEGHVIVKLWDWDATDTLNDIAGEIWRELDKVGLGWMV